MNKRFKKLVSAVTASLLCMTAGTFPLSAFAYDSCDVNHDGDVDILDVINVNRYCSGTLSGTNYYQLDADQNCIVNKEDATCILNKITNALYSTKFYSRQNDYVYPYLPSTSGHVCDAYATSTGSRTYWKYCIGDGSIETYVLSPSTASINSQQGDSINQVIGIDTRYPIANQNAPEKTGIVEFHTNMNMLGNGFIIGDHTIATSASAVNISNYSSLNISTFNANGTYAGALTPLEVHIPVNYLNNHSVQYDYALVTVQEDLSSYFHFNLGNAYNLSSSKFSNVPIYVTGMADLNTGTTQLCCGEGRVYGNSNTSFLKFTTDTTSEQSGSPVFTISRINNNGTSYDNYTVLGIYSSLSDTSNYNTACLISKYQLQFYSSANTHVLYNAGNGNITE